MNDIPGLTYCPNLLDAELQETVLKCVDTYSWMNDLKRRVQHYGYRYDYKNRAVDYSMYLGELPVFALLVAGRLMDRELISVLPDQVIEQFGGEFAGAIAARRESGDVRFIKADKAGHVERRDSDRYAG